MELLNVRVHRLVYNEACLHFSAYVNDENKNPSPWELISQHCRNPVWEHVEVQVRNRVIDIIKEQCS